MMFIYKITEVNFLISLRKYHDVTIAISDAAPYTPCLESHKNLIWTAVPLKITQINLKIMHIQEITRVVREDNIARRRQPCVNSNNK